MQGRVFYYGAMPRLTMLPTLIRETLGKQVLPREPEPDLVMDDASQVAAYTDAGRVDGVMSAAYLFHTARISQVIGGCKQVVDLGCGPATQLAQVAELHPDISFMGIDLSSEMLEQARNHVRVLGLDNVDFMQASITDLESISSHSIDGVISTMALHHLPKLELLQDCFREIKRILVPDGAVYLVDFGRLKSLKSVIYFAYMNARHQPHLFTLDYERSLRAAFLARDFRRLSSELLPANVKVFKTSGIPLLVIMKSPDSPLRPGLREQLDGMRRSLPRAYRRDLDDIRLFFRMGGLRNDPFN